MIQSINFSQYPHKNGSYKEPLGHRIGNFVYIPILFEDGSLTWYKEYCPKEKEMF